MGPDRDNDKSGDRLTDRDTERGLDGVGGLVNDVRLNEGVGESVSVSEEAALSDAVPMNETDSEGDGVGGGVTVGVSEKLELTLHDTCADTVFRERLGEGLEVDTVPDFDLAVERDGVPTDSESVCDRERDSRDRDELFVGIGGGVTLVPVIVALSDTLNEGEPLERLAVGGGVTEVTETVQEEERLLVPEFESDGLAVLDNVSVRESIPLSDSVKLIDFDGDVERLPVPLTDLVPMERLSVTVVVLDAVGVRVAVVRDLDIVALSVGIGSCVSDV